MAESAPAGPLAGWTVVLTRPAHAAAESTAALARAGAGVVSLPLLEIVPVPAALDPSSVSAATGAVFVSANAVDCGLPQLRAGGFGDGTACFAVGEATARALRAAGQTQVFAPAEGFDSEHLLALPALQDVQGRTLLLVKGRGTTEGRALIAETLAARGATVVAVPCYERRRAPIPAADRARILQCLHAARPVIIVAASTESLEALEDAFSDAASVLRRAVLAVPHARVAAAARDCGFSRVWIVALSAQNLVESLARHAGEADRDSQTSTHP